MKKPKILLSTNTINVSDLKKHTGDTHILYSDIATAIAIVKAGGLPYYIPSIKPLTHDDINSYLDDIDGVVISGEDAAVNPLYYEESPMVTFQERIDDDRDILDLYLIREAHRRELPLLGICKGAEIINVALGGTLYQNIKEQYSSIINHEVKKSDRSNLTHRLNVEKDSLIHNIFGKDILNVNGGHKEGVKKLADTLRPTSYAEDKIIETYEQKENSFILGIQFHPELLIADPLYLKIFETFIEHSKK